MAVAKTNEKLPRPPEIVAGWLTPRIVTVTVSPSAGWTGPGALTFPVRVTPGVPYVWVWLETPVMTGEALAIENASDVVVGREAASASRLCDVPAFSGTISENVATPATAFTEKGPPVSAVVLLRRVMAAVESVTRLPKASRISIVTAGWMAWPATAEEGWTPNVSWAGAPGVNVTVAVGSMTAGSRSDVAVKTSTPAVVEVIVKTDSPLASVVAGVAGVGRIVGDPGP